MILAQSNHFTWENKYKMWKRILTSGFKEDDINYFIVYGLVKKPYYIFNKLKNGWI